eukprot:11830-Heterococcus_DN1.PRE.2
MPLAPTFVILCHLQQLGPAQYVVECLNMHTAAIAYHHKRSHRGCKLCIQNIFTCDGKRPALCLQSAAQALL